MNIKELIASMLTENTGSHILDSGGAHGRNWERQKGKTVQDFEKEPGDFLAFAEYAKGNAIHGILFECY